MESTQSIKRRIRAVQNTSQITKAMEMVSATKMRKSQEVALASRAYAFKALELLDELTLRTPITPKLMERRPVKHSLIVVVAADRGLAGSLNSNVMRRVERLLRELEPEETGEHIFAAVGKKAEDYLNRRGTPAVKAFTKFGDFIEVTEVEPLADLIITGFKTGTWDKVIVVATHFRSTLQQDVVVRNLLPATHEAIAKVAEEIIPEYGRYAETERSAHDFAHTFEYLIEPSPETVIETLTDHLVMIQIYHFILEANASEHSARMVAMKNASENASELKDELTLLFNKSRQAAITQEISEISAGAEALKTG